jgi:hypothetical protein
MIAENNRALNRYVAGISNQSLTKVKERADSLQMAMDQLGNDVCPAAADLNKVASCVRLPTWDAICESLIVKAYPPHGLAD